MAENTFDFLDSSAFVIEKDEKVLSYLKSMSKVTNPIYQYNQNQKGKVDTTNMCTVFSNSTAASSLVNVQITRDQLEQECLIWVDKYHMRISGGNETQSWWKSVSTYFNKTLSKKVWFFACSIWDEYFELALDKGLLAIVTMIWYKTGNINFFTQVAKWEIVGWDMRSKVWHAICIGRWNDWGYVFYNSDTKLSKGKCSKQMLQDMMKQQVFFIPARIWLPLDQITKLSPEAYKAVQNAITANSSARQYVDDKTKATLHDLNIYLKSLL